MAMNPRRRRNDQPCGHRPMGGALPCADRAGSFNGPSLAVSGVTGGSPARAVTRSNDPVSENRKTLRGWCHKVDWRTALRLQYARYCISWQEVPATRPEAS